MPTFESYEPGWPCWVDLSSPDVDASKTFYAAVFGWTADDQFDDEGNRIYTNVSLDGQQVCGLGGQPPGMEGMPAIWMTYVCTADAETTAERVTAAGGSVLMPPMEVMDAGSMAVFTDPTGAGFSVWQPAEHKGAGVANDPNTWSWNELLSSDLPTAQAFYTDVFGWEYESQEMPGGTYHVIAGGEHGGLGGMMDRPADMPAEVPDHWGVYFASADVDATVEQVTSNGGMVVFGPEDMPGVGRLATVVDPQGGSFSVMQPAEQG